MTIEELIEFTKQRCLEYLLDYYGYSSTIGYYGA